MQCKWRPGFAAFTERGVPEAELVASGHASTRMLESVSVHQVAEFLAFIVGLVATLLKSLYGTLAELFPAPVWAAVGAAVFVLILYARLASRMENVETTLELLNAKLDTVLSHLTRARTHPDPRDADDRSRT